jgi:hypothetical protein
VNDETMRELIRQGRGPVDDCTCPPTSVDNPTPSDPNCPGVVRDRRLRSQMAAAWDDGMAAFSQGLGSSDNPYREWSR